MNLAEELWRFRDALYAGPFPAVQRRLDWLHRLAGRHASWVFRATPARIVPEADGLWRPLNETDDVAAGEPAMVLPALDADGGLVDLVAVALGKKGEAGALRRRTGLATLLGEDLLALKSRCAEAGTVRLYPDPLAWLRGWDGLHGPAMDKLAMIGRQARLAAGISPGDMRPDPRLQLAANRFQRRCIAVQQLATLLPSHLPDRGGRPGVSPGLCVLDWSAPIEAELAGFERVVCDDVALGERLTKKLRDDRKARRGREAGLPPVLVPKAEERAA